MDISVSFLRVSRSALRRSSVTISAGFTRAVRILSASFGLLAASDLKLFYPFALVQPPKGRLEK
jgi:hypothetical protein